MPKTKLIEVKESRTYEDKCEQIKELSEKGYGTRKIASLLGCGRKPIQTIFKKMGIDNSSRNKCKNNDKLLFSTTDIQKIKEMFNDGYGERKIADLFECSRGPIKRIFKELHLNNKGRHKRKTAHLEKTRLCLGICGEVKDIEEFYKRKGRNSYRISYCSPCEKIRVNQHRIDNIDHIKYKEKEYRSKNRQKLSIENNIYYKNRKKVDPEFKLRKNLSSLISVKLSNNNGSKEGKSCVKYLTYTTKQLKQHLESLFEPWMNWSNYGRYYVKTWNDNDQSTWTWNIDHIIPQSDLPYNTMEHINFQKCWALENLRPYSAKQNNIDSKFRPRTNIKD